MDLTSTPLLGIDLETTGLHETNDRIVEVALVRFEGGEPVARYGGLVDPRMPIPPEALDVLAHAESDYVGQPSIDEFLREIVASCIVQDAIPCAWNADFHSRFLLPALGRVMATTPMQMRRDRWLDPHLLFRAHPASRALPPWRGPKLSVALCTAGVEMPCTSTMQCAEAGVRLLLALQPHLRAQSMEELLALQMRLRGALMPTEQG